jgi:prephenate dehydratase
MSSFVLPKAVRVAFQGRLGAYSESACLHLFGKEVQLFPKTQFEDVFLAIEKGEVDFGVLPVENSTTGSIHENFDLILKYSVPIVAEIKLQIEHALLAQKGVKITDLKGVRSHPQALGQCSNFFKEHSQIECISEFDTAGAAEIISRGNGSEGAIASALAAEEYGLQVLRHNLENQQNTNITRFWCLSQNKNNWKDSNKNKLSILFQPSKNVPGILYQALGVFAKRHMDLLKIESRPIVGSPWEYVFYIDLDVSDDHPDLELALEELQALAHKMKILGHYEMGETRTLFTTRK